MIDNTSKFSTMVEVFVIDEQDGMTTILVLDNGPGISKRRDDSLTGSGFRSWVCATTTLLSCLGQDDVILDE